MDKASLPCFYRLLFRSARRLLFRRFVGSFFLLQSRIRFFDIFDIFDFIHIKIQVRLVLLLLLVRERRRPIRRVQVGGMLLLAVVVVVVVVDLFRFPPSKIGEAFFFSSPTLSLSPFFSSSSSSSSFSLSTPPLFLSLFCGFLTCLCFC